MSAIGSNVFAGLKKLLPDPPLAIGEVISSHSDGTATVEFPGGGQQRVRSVMSLGSSSAVSAGDRVFVRNGVIEGGAPALSTTSISAG
jgi:hypothetical protein